MTRRQLYHTTIFIISTYAVALILAFVFKATLPEWIYNTYKDVLPLIIAMPAAYLAFCFQRRNAYMQALRSLWSNIIVAVQLAFDYTFIDMPTREQYAETLSKLSISIDEVRGVFCNIDEKNLNRIGLYPFEPLKDIRNEIRKLGFGESINIEKQKQVRSKISGEWRELRAKFLLEFDREVPTYPSSKYVIESKD